MDQDSPQLLYADGFEDLDTVLKSVKQPGSYCTSGTISAPMPLLKIGHVDTISFPVPVAQCRRMIRKAATKAPYGRGNNTLLDESVRKVWQVDSDNISLGGVGWEKTLPSLLEKVATGLGCKAEQIEADLYKLLVYEKGGFFKPHRDSEKAGGMFGTLVISLPSKHTGGCLHVRHLGQDCTVDLTNEDPGLLSYAAFYADCEHEVMPVESGFRVCLVFNLIQKTPTRKKRLRPTDYRSQIEKAGRILKERLTHPDEEPQPPVATPDPFEETTPNGPEKIVWLLNHHYTPAGLSYAGLKNRDAAVADVLREAAKAADCSFHLGIVHLEESGWAEWEGDYHRHRRHWEDEDDDDSDDYSVGEVCDWHYFIDGWRDSDDQAENFGKIPLESGEALPVGALEGEAADDEHFYEATGNEGASFERTYLRAACVIWPSERTDDICISAGIDAVLGLLEQRTAACLKSSGKDRADRLSGLARLTPKIVAGWNQGNTPGLKLKRFIRAMEQLGDNAIIRTLPETFVVENYTGAQNEELAGLLPIMGAKPATRLVKSLFREKTHEYPAPSIDLWTRLAAGSLTPILKNTLAALLDALSLRATADPRRPRRRVSAEDPKAPELKPDLLLNFLAAVRASSTSQLLDRATDTITGDLAFFDPETILLPTLELLSNETPDRPPAFVQGLWRETLEFFLTRAKNPPLPPSNWTMPVDFPEKRTVLRELAAFVRNPDEQEHRFKVRQEIRRTIHQTIDRFDLDMTHVTERRGRPLTLVCRKTLGSYKNACKSYRRHISAIGKLSALPIGKTRRDGDIRKRTESAQSKFAHWTPARKPGKTRS